MPLKAMLVIFMKLNDGVCVDVRKTPWPVVFWIVPPVHVDAVEMQVPALPVTVKPAVVPVLLRTIPFVAPFAEMLWNFRPVEPIVVLATLSAGAVVVVRVFTTLVLSTLTG